MTQPMEQKKEPKPPMGWPAAIVDIVLILAVAAVVITCLWTR